MDQLVRIMDDIDDVTGLAFSAVTPAGIAGLAASFGLLLAATIFLGLRGTVLALIVCGVSMGLSSLRPGRRR